MISSDRNSNREGKSQFSIISVLASQYRSHSVLLDNAVRRPRWIMNLMKYWNSRNFTRQHKSAISMEWFLLWATACSHLGQENNSRRPKRNVLFIKITSYIAADMSGEHCSKGDVLRFAAAATQQDPCQTVRTVCAHFRHFRNRIHSFSWYWAKYLTQFNVHGTVHR